MLVSKRLHLELEVLKWLAAIALAAAVVFGLAVQTAGADAMPEPGLLPDGINQWSSPMAGESADVPAPTVDPAIPPNVPAEDIYDRTMRLWNVLRLHQDNEYPAKALAAWAQVRLDGKAEAWRQLAVGLAHFQMAEFERASEKWAVAGSIDPENAVVHYYLGLLRLTQARMGAEPLDALGPDPIRLASGQPYDLLPRTKEAYEMEAIRELHLAIELAPKVALDQPLIDAAWVVPDPYELAMPLMTPTVEDLLVALGADNFDGKAHNVLSYLHLDRGELNEAERHMDSAAGTGLTIVYGYSDLGERYEANGQYADAARAYLKALTQNRGVAGPVTKVLENLRRALLDLF